VADEFQARNAEVIDAVVSRTKPGRSAKLKTHREKAEETESAEEEGVDKVMDEELKQYLNEMKRELREHVNAVEARLEARFTDFEKRIMERVDARFIDFEKRIMERVDARFTDFEKRIMERVGGRIDAAEERLKEFIGNADRDLETKIIREFWKWARTSDLRTNQAISTSQSVSDRLLAVEDRVTALERGGR
jgi:hypothetical protein